MFTHKVGQSYTNDAGTVKSTIASYVDDFEIDFSDTVAAGASNTEFDVAVTKDNIQSMVLTCDKAVTVKTNSSGSPQETIPLAAGQAIIWASDHTEVCPFAGNVTKFFVSNAGSAVANFRFAALLHQAA